MPNQTAAIMIKKPKPEVMAISALLAVSGVGMILWFLKGKAAVGYGAPKKISADEFMTMPIAPQLENNPNFTIKINPLVPMEITNPTVKYQGPGRDTYVYVRAVQIQGLQEVSVMASGIAGVHVGPSSELAIFNLVATDQPQPVGDPRSSLLMYDWPLPQPLRTICPLSGAPPVPGYADVLLEIYQNAAESGDPRDADGFSSPTYNGRVPVQVKRYKQWLFFAAS